MEKVVGIGGFFFRSTKPKRLARWYEKNFGINLSPEDYETQPWHQKCGSTVFHPFGRDTEFFSDSGKGWMIIFRVNDLMAMVAQLQASNIQIKSATERPNGLFACLEDPEGNPIQLWQETKVEKEDADAPNKTHDDVPADGLKCSLVTA